MAVVAAGFSLNAQLVNGDFESTITSYASSGFPEASNTAGWGDGIYVAESSSPGQGAQSVKLVSSYNSSLNAIFNFPSDTMPGFIIQEVNGPVTNASAISMSFKYKYAPVGTDTAMVAVEIYDTMAAGFNDDVLLYAGYLITGANVSSWTNATIPVQSAGGTGTPNQIYIYALASAGGFYPSQFNDPNPGSALWLDAVAISSSASINENEISANVYPNPAADVINIKTTEEVASIIITSMDGKVVSTSTTSQVNVADLTAGIYQYQVTTLAGKVGNGKFVKK